MAMQQVGIVGAGTMGNGIAQVFALAGHAVCLVDSSAAALDRAMEGIRHSLERMVKKEKITSADAHAATGRIVTSQDLGILKDCDLVVEAVFETFEVKREIFLKLDELLAKQAILATNTSSISITELASLTRRADQVIGMHFFNPVPMMKLVEVIRGEATSDETCARVTELAQKLAEAA